MTEQKTSGAEQKTGMSNGSQMRITKADKDLIKAVFKGNEPLLLLMRKIFLPEIDPNAPIGQVIDLWMTVKVEGLSLEEQLINLKARNSLISHVDNMLMTLKLISELEEQTPEQAALKTKANSSK